MIKKKKIAYIAVATVGILAVTALVIAISIPKPVPVFSFDESKAPGWWAGKSHNPRDSTVPEEYQGDEPIDKLPIAGINLLKGEEGDFATACFVMFSYYDYETDISQLKKDKEAVSSVGMSMKNIGESEASMDVLGEAKEFTITKYELTGPDSENSMKGMSYGWVGMDDGHISVSGACPEGSELDDTITAISAVSLSEQ